MESLIALTQIAADKIKSIKIDEYIAEDKVLRAKLIGGGCQGFMFELDFDNQREDDVINESYGVIIVVDNISAMYLDGTIIDYIDGLMGAGFKFNVPNSTSCACGSSVSF